MKSILFPKKYDSTSSNAEQSKNIIEQKETKIKELEDKDKRITLEKYLSFLKNDPVGQRLGMYFILFSSIPIVIFLIGTFRSKRKRRNIRRAFKNGGGKYKAAITSLTGTAFEMNDNPQYRITIGFVYKGTYIKKTVKKVFYWFSAPYVGQSIEIVYDPLRKKIYLIDDLDEEELKTIFKN